MKITGTLLLLLIFGCSRPWVFKTTDYSSTIKYHSLVKTYVFDTLERDNILIEYYDAEKKLMEEISYGAEMGVFFDRYNKTYRTKYNYNSDNRLISTSTSFNLDSLVFLDTNYRYDTTGNLIGKCLSSETNCQTIFYSNGLKQKELITARDQLYWAFYEYDQNGLLSRSYRMRDEDTFNIIKYLRNNLDTSTVYYNYRYDQYDEGYNVTETFVYDALGRLNKKIINSTQNLDEGYAFTSHDCLYEFDYDSFGRKKTEIIRNHKGEVWVRIYYRYE